MSQSVKLENALNDQMLYPFAEVNKRSFPTTKNWNFEAIKIPASPEEKVEEKVPGTILIHIIMYYLFNLYA